jgi:hypothetical protein
MYWCALNLMFHPKISSTNEMDLEIVKKINEGVRLAANMTFIASGGNELVGNHSLTTTEPII